jgi:hypothetical protein
MWGADTFARLRTDAIRGGNAHFSGRTTESFIVGSRAPQCLAALTRGRASPAERLLPLGLPPELAPAMPATGAAALGASACGHQLVGGRSCSVSHRNNRRRGTDAAPL